MSSLSSRTCDLFDSSRSNYMMTRTSGRIAQGVKRHRMESAAAGQQANPPSPPLTILPTVGISPPSTVSCIDGAERTQGKGTTNGAVATAAIVVVNKLLTNCPAGTQTKAGWCLRQGLVHVGSAQDGFLLPLVQRYGPPAYFHCCRHTTNCSTDGTTPYTRVPTNTFESLCRIVAGQFVSGVSAEAAWKRLLAVTNQDLSPANILRFVDCESDDDDDEESNLEVKFQKPAGLTKAKARSIVDLARHFQNGSLSEEFLTTTSDQDRIRAALLQVKGIGPWSCDIFLQLYLEHSNVLPLGDLGVRKGIAKQFGIQATGNPKKDKLLRERLQVYEPYLSLVTYYMWRVIDTPVTISASAIQTTAKTPTTKQNRRNVTRQVTP